MPSEIEQDIFNEQNRLRTQPQSFLPWLKDLLGKFDGDKYKLPSGVWMVTNEGPSAVKEAIKCIEKMKPLPPFTWSDGMARAAKDHVADLGPIGATGHNGKDGSDPFSRMERYGDWLKTAGENLSYGDDKGLDVIMALFIDDGVPSRGHRTNLLKPAFTHTGLSLGYHKNYDHMVSIEYSGGFDSMQEAQQKQDDKKQKKEEKRAKKEAKRNQPPPKPEPFTVPNDLDRQVLDAHNLQRTNPKKFIKYMEDLKKKFLPNDPMKYVSSERPNAPVTHIRTNEGIAAVDEAIQAAKKQGNLPPLEPNEALSKAAKDHVKDCGPKGVTGHTGTDGSSMGDRIKRYGDPFGEWSENIMYGSFTGIDIIMQLFIDDGVSSRGHRKNMQNPNLLQVGLYTGNHKSYETMTTLDYAQGVSIKGKSIPLDQQMNEFAEEEVDFSNMPTSGWKGYSTSVAISTKGPTIIKTVTREVQMSNGGTMTLTQTISRQIKR